MANIKLTHDLLAFQYNEEDGSPVRVYTHIDTIDSIITVILVDAANNIEDHAFQFPEDKCLETAQQDLIAMFKLELCAVTH